jgi:hypothetical protein
MHLHEEQQQFQTQVKWLSTDSHLVRGTARIASSIWGNLLMTLLVFYVVVLAEVGEA